MPARPVDATEGLDASRLHYPEHLPVVARRADLLAAMREHQVVVVAGETGSGKTTQLPKMLLELGRGAGGAQIGHTQPRRIAARSVAERIAEEMHVELGGLVGYQVRFGDHSSDATRLKVMTDGILLSEMQRDRELRRYDTIVIDEAHERSLNIDFILGYLKQLLPRRPDLKVVITSATIDPERFARHFGTDARGQSVREVPVLEVSGRTFPVEVRYRPLVELDPDGRHVVAEKDQVTGVVEAVEELWTEAPPSPEATDILVFFSGEREIRDAAEALEALRLPRTEVLPLFARLSAAEQHRVFRRTGGRRIVLATNVAETSLTVPGIGYVVDTGTARISRYSQRTKVQRLPIEPVSRASAAQRAGRCGRVAPGVCIRLYSEEDLEAREEFTEPEIQRTSLASVILQMTSLGLGDVARFPFVDPPDARQVADGVRLLEELGAFSADERGAGRHRGRGRRLTATGRTLARMPLDPRLARMVVEAGRLGCTREVLVLVAALSIQDPRERPVDKEAQAAQQHARFTDERSDFAAYLTLWRYLRTQQKELSHGAFRRMCKNEYLHYLRIREWQDLHAQLRRATRQARIDPDLATAAQDADPDWDTVHRALLAGLLSHVGVRDQVRREYLGARGARFGISPGSALFRRTPEYVMAGELVETSRLWARTVAVIDPAWAEEAGAHVVTRTVSEPRWSKKAGAAVATERVTLYGVPLVTDRTVQYARVDPEASRDIFIRSALVEGDWDPRHDFWAQNRRTLARVAELEERARRRDIVVDDDVVYAFYDARLPADVVSERHFDRWWRGERRRRPDLLTLSEADLTSDAAGSVSAADYPRTWRQGDLELDVTYQFAPGQEADGVTVHVPVTVLNRVRPEGFDWQVPGLREDLAVALLRSLPKVTRRHFVPAPDHAAAALREADPDAGPLTSELARVLRERTGVRVDPADFDLARVPDHLRVTFALERPGRRGPRVVASGKDLEALREQAGGAVREGMARAGASLERSGITAWDVATVPETFEGRAGGQTVLGYPALVDEGDSVALRVLPDAGSAAAAHRAGVRRLLLLGTSAPWKRVLGRLSNAQKLALADNPHGSVPALLQDCLDAAVDDLVAEHVTGPVRTPEAFEAALAAVRAHAATRVLVVVEAVEPVLVLAAQVRRTLEALGRATTAPSTAAARADVRAQLDGLVRPGFVAATGRGRLADLQRYLRAAQHRLERAATNPREPVLQEQVDAVETAYADLLERLPAARRQAPEVAEIGWLVEELRVSLFAQALGTAVPVSEKRVRRAIAAVDG
ncbi:ATP-dependent RNA helicase HrpA [Phycicoccus endophyticus]|uniref:ATP-dependent RNA helicase HrpA n=1 Tax=Phycicoccus endophyticus TaxID=1690220 RepID=UPI001407B9BB|nr:ATP-dependent RNA helicase HrpA [Phycicoccus endophyticus]NHI20659.1 ATP-dependent RNA helicase HrpA [Phycicoccus endophyticus]GGL43512.1 ATP-dependent helicase [Phycicoccus endophyticus]